MKIKIFIGIVSLFLSLFFNNSVAENFQKNKEVDVQILKERYLKKKETLNLEEDTRESRESISQLRQHWSNKKPRLVINQLREYLYIHLINQSDGFMRINWSRESLLLHDNFKCLVINNNGKDAKSKKIKPFIAHGGEYNNTVVLSPGSFIGKRIHLSFFPFNYYLIKNNKYALQCRYTNNKTDNGDHITFIGTVFSNKIKIKGVESKGSDSIDFDKRLK